MAYAKNELPLPKDLYSEHLATINGINFTPREIEIIACLVSMRGTSKIASLLSIYPRTVSSHIRNIMLKLGCGSRDSIIDFMERAGKIAILRTYYSSLTIEVTFEKTLKEISKLKPQESPKGIALYWQSPEQRSRIIRHLKDHLTQAGIKAKVQDYNAYQKSENIETSYSNLLLLLANKDHQETSEELQTTSAINLSEQENYYFSVFEILKHFFPSSALERFITGFREQYEDIGHHSEDVPKESLISEQNKKLVNPQSLQLSKTWIITFAICIIAMLGIGFLAFKEKYQENSGSFLSQYLVDKPLVRSDLIIPTESVILKRAELINGVDKKLAGRNGIQIIALVGPGGAGKTTLARQYAHQQKSKVIWEINAESHESLKTSFESLARALAQTEEDQKILRHLQDVKAPLEKDEKILMFIKKHLRSYSNWLLIYDNVKSFSDIQKYFPHDSETWGRGKLILTTQDSNISNNKYIALTIRVGELDPSQKLELFTKIMKQDNTYFLTKFQNAETKKFLEEIPPFPLDISIAAYYLKTTNVPYRTYLKNLSYSNKEFTHIQENLLKESGDYTKSRYNIISLSLRQIIKVDESFKELLLFISLLDSQNIPKDLLEKHKNSVVADNLVYQLKKYSLITVTTSTAVSSIPCISIHRSTQKIILSYLKQELNLGKDHPFIHSIASTLENYITDIIDEDDFSRVMLIIPHVEAFLNYDKLLTPPIKTAIESELGGCYWYVRRDIQAKQLVENVLANLNQTDPKYYFHTAITLTYLGNIYRNLDDFTKSEELLNQSLAIYKKYFPKNYVRIAQILMYLGRIKMEEGEYKKAKALFEDGYNLYKKDDSKNYARISWSLACLGKVYRELGNYQKAKNLIEESLSICNKHCPEQSVKIAWALMLLGNVYRNLGNYEMAIDRLEQGIALYNTLYNGQIHWSSVHLANTYRKLGHYAKARGILEKCLASYKNYYPDRHIYIAWILAHLGSTYKDIGDYKKAKVLLEESLVLYKQTLKNDNNIKVAWVFMQLGNCYEMLGDYVQAKINLENALEIYKRYYGDSHLKIARIFLYLGNMHKSLGNFDKARNFIEKALTIYEKDYGKEHIETAKAIKSLGDLYFREGTIDKGEKLFKNALAIFQQNRHPEAYDCLESLGELYLKKSTQMQSNVSASQSSKTQAISYLQQALEVVKMRFPADSPHIIRIQSKVSKIK